MRNDKKQKLLWLRRRRMRKKISGTKECPRMSVRFTGQNIHVQFVDDEVGHTLAAVSTLSKSLPEREKLSANAASAVIIGRIAAETAMGKGIHTIVFDRSGSRYHGKIKALADAARKVGLKF